MHESTTIRRSGTRWERYLNSFSSLLRALVVTDEQGNEMRLEAGFRLWCEWAQTAKRNHGCIFMIGNGASASMASHTAADVGKGAGMRTQVFTDVALMTAVANDTTYEEVFAGPLSWSMNPGDVLVAISSSGNSPNIVRGVEQARDLDGHTVTLTGMGAENAVRKLGDLNFYLPADTYGLAETTHAAILHHWVDRLVS